MTKFKTFIAFCFITSIFVAAAEARDIKFEASLDRNAVAIGEAAQLGLSFYGTQSMPAPDIGDISGLEIRYLGPSTMMTVMNGQVSSSITHMYTILPLKVGKFQIGPFSFTYKGDKYTCNEVFLEVTEEKAVVKAAQAVSPLPQDIDLGERIFLTLDVGKTTAYVNELIPVTVKLYVNRINVSDIQLPTFEQEGFSKVEFKEPKQYREQSGGVVYEVLEFRTNIFGTRSGEYRLGPAKVKCNVMVRKSMPRRGSMRDEFAGDDSFRDSFYDDFFTRYERHPLELKSQETRLIISPLPAEGRPPDFSGAVGDYQFIYDASPAKLKVGDPVTVRMTINGTGNFNTVLIPRSEETAGFKAYEPQVKTGENSKTFTQVLIPEAEQANRIPKTTFTYFDPNRKEYMSITQGPIPIQVEKGKDEAPSQVIGPAATESKPQAQEELARDIIYIKESPGRWVAKGRRVYRSRIFLALIIAPLVFLMSLYVIQAKRSRMARDAAYAGRVAAFRSAKRGFKGLRQKLNSSDPKVFYETLFKTLQEYLGNRLGLPPAGITADVADKALPSRGVDLDILAKVRSLFRVCDEARFAGWRPDSLRMKDDLKELEEIVRYFERRKL